MAENSTSNELKRLLDLQTAELLKELNEARERFREYLRKHGIEVPNMLIVDQPQGISGEPGRSILLDDFNVQTIKAIDKSVITVYSTAGSFLKLFDLLPSCRPLEDMTVTIEGKPPCTAKDLHEQVKNSTVPKDAQLVVASADLKALLGDLEPKAGSEKSKGKEAAKAANLDSADIGNAYDKGKEPLAPASQKAAAPKPQTPKAQPPKKAQEPVSEEEPSKPVKLGATPPLMKAKDAGEGKAKEPAKSLVMSGPMPPSSKTPLPASAPMLSAAIAQEAFDELFSMSEDEFEKLVNPPAEEESQGDAPSLNQNELDALLANVEATSHTAETSGPVGQNELDAILSEEKPSGHKPESASADQAEIDALLSAAKPQKANPSAQAGAESESGSSIDQSELDALLAAKSEPKAPASSVDQSEIDALLAAKPEPKAPASSVDQSEIDALLAAKPEPVATNPGTSTISQSELDAMFTAKPAEAAVEEPALPFEVSQDELDKAINAKPDASKSFGILDVADDNEGIGQEVIDKAFGNAKPKQEAKPVVREVANVADSPGFNESADISQDELDKLFGNKPHTISPMGNHK